MRTILLTAFEPFGGADVNPAACVTEVLANDQIPGVRLVTAVLPVVAGDVLSRLAALPDQHAPDAVPSLRDARGGRQIRVERRAVNRLAFQTDNSGAAMTDGVVITGGADE